MMWIYLGLSILLLLVFFIYSIIWDLYGMFLFLTGRRSKKQVERQRRMREQALLNRVSGSGEGSTSLSNFRIGDTAFNEVGLHSWQNIEVDNSDTGNIIIEESLDVLDETAFIEIEDFSSKIDVGQTGSKSPIKVGSQKINSVNLQKISEVDANHDYLLASNSKSKDDSIVYFNTEGDLDNMDENESPVETEPLKEYGSSDGFEYYSSEGIRLGDAVRSEEVAGFEPHPIQPYSEKTGEIDDSDATEFISVDSEGVDYSLEDFDATEFVSDEFEGESVLEFNTKDLDIEDDVTEFITNEDDVTEFITNEDDVTEFLFETDEYSDEDVTEFLEDGSTLEVHDETVFLGVSDEDMDDATVFMVEDENEQLSPYGVSNREDSTKSIDSVTYFSDVEYEEDATMFIDDAEDIDDEATGEMDIVGDNTEIGDLEVLFTNMYE